jgi:hypothetical protein
VSGIGQRNIYSRNGLAHVEKVLAHLGICGDRSRGTSYCIRKEQVLTVIELIIALSIREYDIIDNYTDLHKMGSSSADPKLMEGMHIWFAQEEGNIQQMATRAWCIP